MGAGRRSLFAVSPRGSDLLPRGLLPAQSGNASPWSSFEEHKEVLNMKV